MTGAEIWSIDTEFGFHDGRLDCESAWEPVCLCLVGLLSGERIAFWGWDHRLPAFFREHADDLYVAHYAIAEMKFLSRRGIPLPRRLVRHLRRVAMVDQPTGLSGSKPVVGLASTRAAPPGGRRQE